MGLHQKQPLFWSRTHSKLIILLYLSFAMSLIFIAVAIDIGLNGLKLSQRASAIISEVKAAHRVSGGSAGAKTIVGIVTTKGVPLSRYKATNIMKNLGLVSYQVKKHRYKKAENEHLNISNILDRQFAVAEPNQVW